MPSLSLPRMRVLVASARSATLGTLGSGGTVHLVPICFALDGDTIVSAVDEKPKRSPALQRLRNVEATGTATLLADGYDEDWERLWWVRVSGPGRVLAADAEAAATAHALLGAKYPQYATHRLGAVLMLTIESWRGWSARGAAEAADNDR